MKPQWSGLLATALFTFLQGAAATKYLRPTQADEYATTLLVRGNATRDPPPGPLPHDYNPETNIIWVDKSTIPVSVEAFIACLWITMVASMPLVGMKLEGRAITKTQLVVFAVMWIVFLGGIFLFTQVLLFQSVHFKTIRSLTIVETVYLMSQILTTVGYGDITPAKPRGQVFVGIYVLVSLLIIANVVSDVTSLISEHTKKYTAKLEQSALELHKKSQSPIVRRMSGAVLSPQSAEALETDVAEKEKAHAERLRELISHAAPPLPWGPLVKSLMAYTGFVILGCLFFVNYPGEDRTVFQGIYMSIITLSTVGFGAFTPVTEGGKVFGAFWMLFGSASLVALVGCFTELMLALKAREQFNPTEIQAEDDALLERCPEQMTSYDFAKFGLLRSKKVNQTDIDHLEEVFKMLGADEDGTVSRDKARGFILSQ